MFWKKHSKINYSKSEWYLLNYRSLGSKWLIRSLELLNLKEPFILANFSANAGYYEKDVFDYLVSQGKKPYFILSDLSGNQLKDEIIYPIQLVENYNYCKGNYDAYDMRTISRLCKNCNGIDVILDIKGAMWYALTTEGNNGDNFDRLLVNYDLVLGRDGVLVIDCYEEKYPILGEISMKISNSMALKRHFAEKSTIYYLDIAFQNKTKYIGKTISNNMDLDHPLSSKMKVRVYNKNDIREMIDIWRSIEDEQKKSYFSNVKHVKKL